MPNKSHHNSGHRAMNLINKNGKKHSSFVKSELPKKPDIYYMLKML